MSRVVGIDLGTVTSCVAAMDEGSAMLMQTMEGGRLMPSIVSFLDDGGIVVGQRAKERALTHPASTVTAVKRLLGQRYDAPGVQEFARMTPYRICPGPDGEAHMDIGGRRVTPEEVASFILQHMKGVAEAYLGESITQAVLAVPAHFAADQLQAVRNVGLLAGMEIKQTVHEPTAAALAYGIVAPKHENIAIFDLGGGTFDISILAAERDELEVLATGGDTFLGGIDFDHRLLHHVANEFMKRHDFDLRSEPPCLQRLYSACERAKCILSTENSALIDIPFIAKMQSKPLHLRVEIQRDQAEDLFNDLLDRIEGPIMVALKKAELAPEDIHEVLLVGGMTRMPAIQKRAEAIFTKSAVRKSPHPDELVALGAALYSRRSGGRISTPKAEGVVSQDLGIEGEDGRFVPLILQGSVLPATAGRIVTTSDDEQEFARIQLYEGPHSQIQENTLLGTLELSGLRPAAAGELRIEITLFVPEDGLVEVTARNRTSGLVANEEFHRTQSSKPGRTVPPLNQPDPVAPASESATHSATPLPTPILPVPIQPSEVAAGSANRLPIESPMPPAPSPPPSNVPENEETEVDASDVRIEEQTGAKKGRPTSSQVQASGEVVEKAVDEIREDKSATRSSSSGRLKQSSSPSASQSKTQRRMVEPQSRKSRQLRVAAIALVLLAVTGWALFSKIPAARLLVQTWLTDSISETTTKEAGQEVAPSAPSQTKDLPPEVSGATPAAGEPPTAQGTLPEQPDPAVLKKIQAYLERGDTFLNKRRVRRAISVYKKAIDLDPNEPMPHRSLGIAYTFNQDTRNAIREYKIFLKLDPDSEEAEQIRGLIAKLENQQ